MLWRDSGVFFFLLLSLIFSILTLTAGNKRGVLDDVAIATVLLLGALQDYDTNKEIASI